MADLSTNTLNPVSLQADELLLAPDYLLLRDGLATGQAVHIKNGRFCAVGDTAGLVARLPHLTLQALPGKLLMPGMIDAHHHLTQSFGKSLAYGEPSEIFMRVWVPLENSLTDEFVYLAGKLAALESLRGGFTTVCDAGTRAPGDIRFLAQATQEAGLRCVMGLICNDGGNSSTQETREAITRRMDQFLTHWEHQPLVHPSLAISVPEAASDQMLVRVSATCAEVNTVFQTHVNEHLASVERSVISRGKRPLELLAHLKALGPQVLIAHGTLVTPAELSILRDTGTAVSYNPVASQWKGNAVAPALLMHESGIRFGLGTDATRSDAFRLLDAAEYAQKLAFGMAVGDASCGAGWIWVDHATHAGADAVGLAHMTGEIAANKAADFLLVDVDTPELCTSVDLLWDLVRLGNRDQIDAVFVDGKLRLWQGWPLDWDARALQKELARIAHAAIAKAPIKRLHLPADQHRKAVINGGQP